MLLSSNIMSAQNIVSITMSSDGVFIFIDKDNNKHCYKNNKLHFDDGPAIEYVNGDKEWYENDMLHRTTGPAAKYADGQEIWYFNGKRHRLDGPAWIIPGGCNSWYYDGEYMDCDSQEEFERLIKIRAFI